MPIDHHKLARLQFRGMLGLVMGVVLVLAGYFFYQQWCDYRNSTASFEEDARLRGQAFLKAYGDHASNSLEHLYKQTQGILRQHLREQVDQAYALAEVLYRQNRHLPPAQQAAHIRDSLRPLRYFDGRGYFFIDTLDGRCVLLPTTPQWEGRSLLDNRDDHGTYIMRALLDSIDNPRQAGFASYRWFRPGDTLMQEKIAYSRRFEPLGWIIGGGEYVQNVERDLQQQGLHALAQMRVGDKGFFAVLNAQGRLLRLTPASGFALEDKPLLKQLAASNGNRYFRFSHRDLQGEHWYTAYVATVPSWQWKVISIIPSDELMASTTAQAARLAEQTRNRVLTTLLILGLATVFAWWFSRRFSHWLGTLIRQYEHRLQLTEQEVREKAREIELTRHMSDSAADIIVLLDHHGEVVYHNEAATRCFCPDNALDMTALFEGDNGDDEQHTIRTLSCCHGDIVLDITLTRVNCHGGHYRCATARDISARMANERELMLAATVFKASSEAILITDTDCRIIAVNRAFTDITGYSEQDALGHTPALLSSGKHDKDFFNKLWHQLRARGRWSGEIWNRRKNGEIYPEWLTINEVRGSDGSSGHYVALFSDISERKATEERVQHMAEYDFLTNLPNRLLLNDRLQQSLHIAERKQHRTAVLFMDLDRFKNVNDTLGHDAGDRLLCQVAQRAQRTLRDMDTVGRTGGDEFVMILPELNDNKQAAVIAERVLQVLEAPFDLEGHTLVISASIGIAVSPSDGTTPDMLLKNADLAMYDAKAAGRNTFRFFSPSMTAEVSERLLLENKLRQAIPQQDIYLELQPKYHIATRTLSGFEALMRWRDSDGSQVPPARFIPVAEDSGLISELGLWILEQSCYLAAEWARQGHHSLTLAVNVSARQLTHGNFTSEVQRLLRQSGVPPQLLELEVTESTLIDYSGPVRQQLAAIKALGVRLAVDDFGTGYSSLAYLKNFAPDTVKIDRSFVSELQHNHDNAAIVSAIITLARNLKMEALAEGVETEEELAALQALGCDTVQGYLTGRPMSVNDALALISLQQPAA